MKDQNTPTAPELAAPPVCGTEGKLHKWDWFALAGILLLGAVLISTARIMAPEMGRDSCYYLLLAEHWHKGGFQAVLKVLPNFWFPPLHLFLITLLSFTGLSCENAAMVIGMGCGILLPLVSFSIAREICSDKRIALAAALLTAVNPSIIEMSIQAQRDVPYLFTVGWGIYFLIAGIKSDRWSQWCGAGIMLGTSLLIRYETAEFFPLILLYLGIALWKKKSKWQLLCRNLAVGAASGIAAIILLICCTGTQKTMVGTYYKYFLFMAEKVQKIFTDGGQKK